MTLLEFVRKLQTPEGRIECAATYGGCLEHIDKVEAVNREMHNQIIEDGESEEMSDAELKELRKCLDVRNMEVEGLRKTISELESEKADLWKRLDQTEIKVSRLAKCVDSATRLEILGRIPDEAIKIIEDFSDRIVSTSKGLGPSIENGALEIQQEIRDKIALASLKPNT